jgi:hypothetical protein
VLKLLHLFDDFAVHRLITVPHADGDDAAEKIEILIAIGVPNELILGARDD